MRKMVYKFLDEYLGDEVTCIKTGSTNRCYSYDIFSKKNKSIILSFKVVLVASLTHISLYPLPLMT
jgi:hypothetical protein